MEPIRNGATDSELADILKNVWIARTDRYSETRNLRPAEKPLLSKVEMYRMGG